MCFSAPASFAGGAIISAVGITTIRKAARPESRLLSIIPLLFAAQQFAEGVIWVTLRSSGLPGIFQTTAAFIFLSTALVVWPAMVPLSVYLMEKVRIRKIMLAFLTLVGVVVSVIYAYCMLRYSVSPQINGFHIQYVDNFPYLLVSIAFPLYLVSTTIPLFISSVPRMWLFGVLITVSCLVTAVFFAQYLTSVWCFFAALISMTIYWVLGGLEAESKERIGAAQKVRI
ncbi:MAG: hypothetical protein JW954_08530 [Dehalococcoidaceae bacterium]|nr:hypothetical protein [Dehalococcoidaceae bacterium]